MGDPVIFWTARGESAVQQISLPWITRLDPDPKRFSQEVLPENGAPLRTDLGGFVEVRVESILDRTQHASTIRRLRSLQSHLQAGGVFGFCADVDKAAGYFTTSAISAGDTAINVQSGGSPFSAWNSSGALASDDEIRIIDGNPDQRIHHDLFSSYSNRTLTIQDGSDFSFGWPALALYRFFYPVLWPAKEMSNDRPILVRQTQHHNVRLMLTGLELPAMTLALHESAEMVLKSDRTGSFVTLDDAVRFATPQGYEEVITLDNNTRWFK